MRATPRKDCRQERAAKDAPIGAKIRPSSIRSARSARLRLPKYDQNGTTHSGRQEGGGDQVKRGGSQAHRTTARPQITRAGVIQRRASRDAAYATVDPPTAEPMVATTTEI